MLCILAGAVVLLLVIPLLVFGIELIIIGLVATVTILPACCSDARLWSRRAALTMPSLGA